MLVTTVDGWQWLKTGAHTCNARTVTLPNGQKVFAGSAETPKTE